MNHEILARKSDLEQISKKKLDLDFAVMTEHWVKKKKKKKKAQK